jgi:hypothetical protein
MGNRFFQGYSLLLVSININYPSWLDSFIDRKSIHAYRLKTNQVIPRQRVQKNKGTVVKCWQVPERLTLSIANLLFF